MRPERKICIELREFLVRSHWEIKSFNPPGLHGGIILLDRSQKRRKGAIKPGNLSTIKQLKEITVDIYLKNPFQLGKGVKTFFSLADIVLLQDNLYIGREQI